MGTTYVKPLCVAGLACMMQDPIPSRDTNNLGQPIQTIVVNSTYQLQITRTYDFGSSVRLEAQVSGVTYSCIAPTGQTNNNQQICIIPNITVSAAPGESIYVSSDNSYFYLHVVDAVPSQPKMSWSEYGFSLQTSEYSSVYGNSSLSACMLAWAPSAATYNGEDLPTTFPRDNASTYSFISEQEPLVGSRIWLNPAENQTMTGNWSELALSSIKNDYYFVCYNDFGVSTLRAILNLQTSPAEASAPLITSAHSFPDDGGAYVTRIDFLAVQNFSGIGIYPDVIFCELLLWCGTTCGRHAQPYDADYFLTGQTGYLSVRMANSFDERPVVSYELRCSTYNGEEIGISTMGVVYAALRKPIVLCGETGHCLNRDGYFSVVEGTNITLQAIGGPPGSNVSFYARNNGEYDLLDSCIYSGDATLLQGCNSSLINTANITAFTELEFCVEIGEQRGCSSVYTVDHAPSNSTVELVLSRDEDNKWSARMVTSISKFSLEYGAPLDGCCWFYTTGDSGFESETNYPYANYSQALNSSAAHTCVDSPAQGSVISSDPSDIFPSEFAGQALSVYHACYSRFGQSDISHDGGNVWVESVADAPYIQYSYIDNSKVCIHMEPAWQTGLFETGEFEGEYERCWVQVMPAGSSFTDAPIVEFTMLSRYDSQDAYFSHDWNTYPSIDVSAQCFTRVGAGKVNRQTYVLPLYMSVQCIDPVMCTPVYDYMPVQHPRVRTAVVQFAMVNITGFSTAMDDNHTFVFKMNGDVVLGTCEAVNGMCSLVTSLNMSEPTFTRFAFVTLYDVDMDQSTYFEFVTASNAPTQPELFVSLDSPSGDNSTITIMSSRYSAEYSVNGQGNLTECLLVWSTDIQSDPNGYASIFRGLNTSYSYSFVPAHQGQQVVLNFKELLPANLTGVYVNYWYQCYNDVGISVPQYVPSLSALASVPTSASNLHVLHGSAESLALQFDAQDSSNVGFANRDQPNNYFDVKVYIGYSGFNLTLGEYNYTFTLSQQPEKQLWTSGIDYTEAPGQRLDFSWAPDWDIYVVIVNQIGESTPANVSFHFDFEPSEDDYYSPIQMHLYSAWSERMEQEMCRTCPVFRDVYSNPNAYYPILQDDPTLTFQIDGWYHQQVTVILMVNETTNFTLADRYISALGHMQLNHYDFNFSSSPIGTRYTVVALSNGSVNDNNPQSAVLNVRVSDKSTAMWSMIYTGVNNVLSEEDQQDFQDSPYLVINPRDLNQDTFRGCMLLWGPTSSLYEATDFPSRFNQTFIDARVAAGTGLYFSGDDVWEMSDQSERGMMLPLDRLSRSSDPQDYHLSCYSREGRSAKSSVYNIVARTTSAPVVSNLTATFSDDLYSANVSVHLPGHTGDAGVYGVGSTVTFASCVFSWYQSGALVGSLNITDAASLHVDSQLNFVAGSLDLFRDPTVMFSTRCFGNVSLSGSAQVYTYVWQNPYNYTNDIIVSVAPKNAMGQITQWSNFSNASPVITSTILQGTRVSLTVSYLGRARLMLVDVLNNSLVVSSCITDLLGVCEISDILVPTAGTRIHYQVKYNDTVFVELSYLSVAAVPTQPSARATADSMYFTASDASMLGCVLFAGTASSSYVAPSNLTYSVATNHSDTVYVNNTVNTVEITQRNLLSFSLRAGQRYHFYWVCYNDIGASAPAALFSVLVVAPSSSSSSSCTGSVVTSSTGVTGSSSSSDAVSVSSSTASPLQSSSSVINMQSSSSAQISSSSAASAQSSTAAQGSSSSTGVSFSSSSDAAGSASSSTASSLQSSSSAINMQSSSSAQISSSSAAVVPMPDVPVGTVKVSFSVTFPNGEITMTFILALTNDILSTIARMFGLPIELVRPFVKIDVGSQTRRLLQQSMPVSFTLLGNVSTIAGNATVDPGITVNATSIATSVAGAITNGTLDSTQSSSLGLVVPVQTVTVQPVVPVGSSSTGGIQEGTNESTSSLSDGGIAGAVIGSIVGAILLIGLAFAVYSGALCSRSPSVSQANANSVDAKAAASPRSASVEMGTTSPV